MEVDVKHRIRVYVMRGLDWEVENEAEIELEG